MEGEGERANPIYRRLPETTYRTPPNTHTFTGRSTDICFYFFDQKWWWCICILNLHYPLVSWWSSQFRNWCQTLLCPTRKVNEKNDISICARSSSIGDWRKNQWRRSIFPFRLSGKWACCSAWRLANVPLPHDHKLADKLSVMKYKSKCSAAKNNQFDIANHHSKAVFVCGWNTTDKNCTRVQSFFKQQCLKMRAMFVCV